MAPNNERKRWQPPVFTGLGWSRARDLYAAVSTPETHLLTPSDAGTLPHLQLWARLRLLCCLMARGALEVLLPLTLCSRCWAVLGSDGGELLRSCTLRLLLLWCWGKARGRFSYNSQAPGNAEAHVNSFFAMGCFSSCWNKKGAPRLRGCRGRSELLEASPASLNP